MSFRRRRRRPLVYEPEGVPELPPRPALRHDPQPHLITHQNEGRREPFYALQKPVESLQRRRLAFGEQPGRDPEGQRVKQHGPPQARRPHDLVEVARLQGPPRLRPPLAVKAYPPREIRVPLGDGGCDVKDLLAAQLPGEALGEGALAAARAARDERPDAYDSSRIQATSAAFSDSPRTATRK